MRRRRIGITSEIHPENVAFTRNHMVVDDVQHGNTFSLLNQRAIAIPALGWLTA
jgi:hypothetical protein